MSSTLQQTDSISLVRECIARAATCSPDRAALVGGHESMTYAQLDRMSDDWAAVLMEHGIQLGHHVAVVAANSPSLVAALFGAWKLGAIVHHHNPATQREVLYRLLRESQTKALFVDRPDEFLEQNAELLDAGMQVLQTDSRTNSGNSAAVDKSHLTTADSDDLACVSYTSGSTGIPCGVELSHRYLIRNAELNLKYFEIASDDCMLLTLPLFFGMNRTTLLAYLMAGATIVLAETGASAADLLTLVDRHQATSLSIVPSIAHQLTGAAISQGRTYESLHSLRIGAGAVTREMLERLRAVFPNARFWITYGLTEIGLVSVVLPDEIDGHFASCGRAVDTVSLRIDVDGNSTSPGEKRGQIIVAARHQALGYSGEARDQAGVFRDDGIHTGDLGYLDNEGFLHLCGRSKDLIKTAGVSVVPREVEEVLESCPGVEEAVVLGVPNRWLGESLVAAVTARPGRTVEVSALHQYCTRALPSVKRPQTIVRFDTFPRTPNGKADRQAVLNLISRATECAPRTNKLPTSRESAANTDERK